MTIAARVRRLEHSVGACGPDCPSLAVGYVGEDFYGQIGPQSSPGPARAAAGRRMSFAS
jgi:hypothetical protein